MKMHFEDNFYEPSYFYMKLDTKEVIYDKINDKKLESDILHEYLHLLQDISLISSRCFMRQNINYLKAISDEIKNNNNPRRPIKVSSESIIKNKNIMEDIFGENVNYSNIKIVDIKYENYTIFESMQREKIILILQSEDGSIIEYKLGFIDFCESMVYSIENYIYKNKAPSDIPYKTIPMILDYYKIKNTNQIIAKICEFSLSHFDPIAAFIRFLRYGKKKTSTNEIFRIMYEGLEVVHYGDSKYDKNVSDRIIFKESKDFLLELYSSEMFNDLYEWLKYLLDWGEKERRERKIFISEYIFNTPKKARAEIFQTMLKTGIPVILNSNYDIMRLNIQKSIDTFYLRALKELFDYLTSERINCNLISYCKKNNLYNDSCCYDVMIRNNDEILCPISVWIKMLGFSKITS